MDIETLKALADERRLAIVELLASRGELCVCELAGALDMSDALVSHHINKLSDAGVVSTRRVGRWLHCSVDTGAVAALSAELAQVATDAGAAFAASAAEGCACTTDRRDVP